jgi:hypothetical protein
MTPVAGVRSQMNLEKLAERIGAKILILGGAGSAEIDRVYAGDRISDLLNHASDKTLLVTNLTSAHILRVAELMDVPGICLLNAFTPEPEVIDVAEKHGTAIMVSPVGMYETCGRLYQCVGEGKTAP